MKRFISLKHTLFIQYFVCALLPLIILSLFLISSFRNIQIDAQIDKQQALTDSVMLSTHFALEKAGQSLLQISRDTNVALAGQVGLFGYSASNALSEYNAGFDFISVSLLVDSQNRVIEALPEAALLLEPRQFNALSEVIGRNGATASQTWFIEAPLLAQAISKISHADSRSASTAAGIIVFSAPLFVTETETLDSRSTYTGKLMAFILADDLIEMIEQSSAALTLTQLKINTSTFKLSNDLDKVDSLTTKGTIQVPFSDAQIEAEFSVSQSNALSAVNTLTIEYSLYAAVIVLVFILICSAFFRAVLQPLGTFNIIVSRYRQGDLTAHQQQFRFSEFQSVSKLLSEMASNISEYQDSLEDKVATRTEALENALTEVKKINRELIRTQDQLIESDKMSQTGLLVAGVAHEVNTPIGICVTATSVLEEKVNLLARAYNDNELSRSVLTDFIKNAHNCLDILSKNTERAADLIHSFKSVSVDQSSDQKRHIEIRSYVDLTIRSLQKELERKQVHINLAGDLSLTIETYPGAISQILSNLILNSLKHGFKHDQTAPRQINIGFTISSSRELNITFKDNGHGVSTESLPKLFEPFYTTSRQSGGSGLGLSIVYNLATQRLGGKINCHCESASGLIVVIEFPVNVIDG